MKTVVIFHKVDLDGWMSAAIVKKWYLEKHYGNTLEHGNVIVDPNEGLHSLTFLGYDYGDEIPDLSEYDKVIMCDVSFPNDIMKDLHLKLRHNLTWIDHHISAIKEIQNEEHNICLFNGKDYLFNDLKLEPKEARINGFRNTKFAACELTWLYFFPNEEMPEIVRLLGMYDSFRHKNTDEEQKVLEFQYGARQVISNYKEAYEVLNDYFKYEFDTMDSISFSGKKIYQYLCTEAKQVYNKAFEIKLGNYFHTKDGVDKFKFLCVNQERFNPVNFGIDYHKDDYDGFACFCYKDGKWMWSLYNDNGEVDCSAIAKKYGGGGHKGASGFVCDNEIMLKIISNA